MDPVALRSTLYSKTVIKKILIASNHSLRLKAVVASDAPNPRRFLIFETTITPVDPSPQTRHFDSISK